MQKQPTEKMKKLPMTEILKAIPGMVGIQLDECPPFTLVKRRGSVEIRQYESMLIARTRASGSNMKEASEPNFTRLANFIFGENSENQQMSMTAPVVTEALDQGWEMTFVLPREFTPSTLPTPLSQEIEIKTLPKRTIAVLPFYGNVDQAIGDRKTTQLLEELAQLQSYEVAGHPQIAQYDQPFAVPFLRKNEIWIEVRPAVREVNSDATH